MFERLDQELATLGVVQQIILQVRVATHHPDIAQDLVQHTCGATCLALAAQIGQQGPGIIPKQATHDFPIGKGGVVIRDFAQAGLRVMRGLGIQ